MRDYNSKRFRDLVPEMTGRLWVLLAPAQPASRMSRSIGLAPWLFATLWAFVGFFLTFLMLASVGTEPLEDKRKEYDLALFQAFQQEGAGTKVVIMGNSMMRYATFPESELREAAASAGMDAAFFRLVSNNAVFSHFDYILDDLLEARPDVIAIQAPLLVQEPSVHVSRFRFFQQYIRWRLIGGDLGGVDPHEVQHDLACPRDVSDQIHEVARDRIVKQRNYDISGANPTAAASFVQRARERGIHVAVITAPTTDKLADYEEARGDSAIIREHAFHQADADWIFPLSMSNNMFCDPIHLGPEGREIYSSWLISQIAEWRGDDQDASLALNIIESS